MKLRRMLPDKRRYFWLREAAVVTGAFLLVVIFIILFNALLGHS